MCKYGSCILRSSRCMLPLLFVFSVWFGGIEAFHTTTFVLKYRHAQPGYSKILSLKRRFKLPSGGPGTVVVGQSSTSTSTGSPSYEDEWIVGNANEDLDRLEQAINFANADQNLQHVERVEMLEHFSKGRRPLFPDVRKYILAPLGLALAMRLLCYNNYQSATIIRSLTKTVTRLMDWHFWTFVVAAPMALLVARRITKPPPEPMPDELKDLDPEYMSFVTTDWESPKTSCRDYVLFLLEYWNSAVGGMAVIGILQTFVKLFPRSSAGGSLWWSSCQFLTRIAALASIYQFPKQTFQLNRAQQPRPVGLFPTLMQIMVRSMFLVAPLGMASDLSKILIHVPKESLIALYTSISALLLGSWIRLQQQSEPLEFRKLGQRSLGGRVLYTAAMAAFWKKPIANLADRLQQFSFQNRLAYWKRTPLRLALTGTSLLCVGITPVLFPIVHILALPKLVRVVYTHDLSLAMAVEAFKSAMENEGDLQKKMMWRHRLEWRDNKRLGPLCKEWNQGWGYWLLAEGTVTEQLALAVRAGQKKADMQGMTVLDRIKDDLASTPPGTVMPDRDEWKVDAMNRIAEKHQADYDSGEFEDPLGVAVQQTFGIGLGYNFDHMKVTEPGETPSVRKLQARAAKSAIRRVQELYDSEAAMKELDGIPDPMEREQKAKEMRKRVDKEIQHLARRLTELVPAGIPEDSEFTSHVQQFKQRSNYVKTSSHEYVLQDPLEMEDSSTEGLLDVFGPVGTFIDDSVEEELAAKDTPAATSDSIIDDNDDGRNNPEAEDEFVEAFLRQQKRGQVNDDDDDDDNDITVVLA